MSILVSPTRRSFLAGALGLCASAFATANPVAQAAKTRLILLGTGGGPRPRKAASASAQAIVVNGALYVVDCGDGVARQIVSAGLSLGSLRHVFLTHHHSDHNADYGNLLLLGWTVGLQRVDTWGPPPIAQMTRQFFELNAFDINTRIADEGRPPLAPLIHPHEITAGGVILQDDNVKVTAALVDHPPIEKAFAYRFDTKDRSIVVSGDTAMSKNLIALAQGADVLVHEALWVPAVDRIVAKIANAATLKKHIIDSHTSAEDCGRVAAAAGVKTLVLSHLVPPDDPVVTDEMWIAAARKHFRGEVIVGKDLMEI
ncbi:MAG TPA: MBL fold metallo-hydrolase [Vicinamibacterales bacterium]|nr:MBL fold metallo-hydrolase [Vicinamibacterales bacterium]